MTLPVSLDNIVGNAKAVETIRIALVAARMDGRLPGHMIFTGPSGTGKTTFAKLVANEFGGTFHRIHGPSITKKNIRELLMAFLKMAENDVLFIDEVHALPSEAMENLYEVLEENQVSIISGNEGEASAVTIKMPPIVIIAATTDPSKLLEPFLMRFSRNIPVQEYSCDELCQIMWNTGTPEAYNMTREDVMEIAKRSRGRARKALQFMAVVKDHIIAMPDVETYQAVLNAFRDMGIGERGETPDDLKYIHALESHNGGPLGVQGIASVSGLTKQNIETTIEPFLISIGLVKKTKMGRILAENR